MLLVDIKKFMQGFRVLIVLMQGILKADELRIDLLCPSALLPAARDKPLHVFRFKHENAVLGDNDMINLRGAIGRRQDNIAEEMIGTAV